MSERSYLSQPDFADSTIAVHGPIATRVSEQDGAAAVSAGRLAPLPVVEPIVQTANFALDEEIVEDLKETGGRRSFSYTRLANPTTEATARVVAALEGAPAAVVVSSGMAAITASITALLPPQGRLVAAEELYGDTAHMFESLLAPRGHPISRLSLSTLSGADSSDLGPADLVYVETLSNPMLRVADLAAIAERSHRAGARLVVDDTFTSPVNLKPLSHGVDLVVSSATKYLNGHSDVIAGVVSGAGDLVDKVKDVVVSTGCSADPFASFLLGRGLKTLPLRVERQNETALLIARALSRRAELELVAYPFLDDHPDRDLAAAQLRGGGGIVTVRVSGGDKVAHLLQRCLRLVRPATSLGGVESVVCMPAETSHLTLSEAERRSIGILPGTLRFSFGLEDSGDLLADLTQALEAVAAGADGALPRGVVAAST